MSTTNLKPSNTGQGELAEVLLTPPQPCFASEILSLHSPRYRLAMLNELGLSEYPNPKKILENLTSTVLHKAASIVTDKYFFT